jgi:predicted ATP-binding protein involved in virulence
MRIRHVEAKGLFGMFDHAIDFSLTDRVTIILGPNGIGKTWMLRLLAAALSPQTSALRVVPFSSFEVAFDNHTTFTILKGPGDDARGTAKARSPLTYRLQEGRKRAQSWTEPARPVHLAYPLSLFEREIPELVRVSAQVWRSVATGEEFDVEGLLERYADRLPEGVFEDRGRNERPPVWLTELRKASEVRLIESQRLFVTEVGSRTSRDYDRLQMQPAVAMYATELARTIQARLADYANVAQTLDRTFPSRVVATKPRRIAPDVLRSQLEALDKRRLELRDAGLLDTGSADTVQVPAEINDSALAVLSVYVDDAQAKLRVLDELAAKTDLLKGTLNRRFRYKSVEINREQGVAVRADDGRLLPLTALSSGEQHEIVLTYELLFHVGRSSLVLVDEPELSLHVAWQEAFLKDLLTMASLGQFDVVLATHSPQIIGDRWDLTVELGANGDA